MLQPTVKIKPLNFYLFFEIFIFQTSRTKESASKFSYFLQIFRNLWKTWEPQFLTIFPNKLSYLLFHIFLMENMLLQTTTLPIDTYLPMFMITSSGIVLFLNFPCLGWSPRPRNKPGGSILKLPTLCLCPSMRQ